MKAKVQKWGNSLALRIPRSFAQEVGIVRESTVEFKTESGRLIITPLEEPKQKLAELLAAVTEENLQHEIDSGLPLGKEVW